ncbi:MAG: Rieske 2Fe-2S domain-containing protein [Thermoproteota archaeon]|nr:Rieske 2Fe-2S domain-containing protein [Thermoproteota archaeon]
MLYCTHLCCTLTWNSLERSFERPSHGSRFSNTGKMINGPTNSDINTEKSSKTGNSRIWEKIQFLEKHWNFCVLQKMLKLRIRKS